MVGPYKAVLLERHVTDHALYAGVAPSSAIFMAVYEPVKHWVYRNSQEDQHWLGPVLAGAAAGAAASLTRVPTEVIKQRLQTREFAGALGAVRKLLCAQASRMMTVHLLQRRWFFPVQWIP